MLTSQTPLVLVPELKDFPASYGSREVLDKEMMVTSVVHTWLYREANEWSLGVSCSEMHF